MTTTINYFLKTLILLNSVCTLLKLHTYMHTYINTSHPCSQKRVGRAHETLRCLFTDLTMCNNIRQ